MGNPVTGRVGCGREGFAGSKRVAPMGLQALYQRPKTRCLSTGCGYLAG